MSEAARRTRSVKGASFTRTGSPSSVSKLASAPLARATFWAIDSIRRATSLRRPSSSTRKVPSITAVSAMMFLAVPACMRPIVTTTGSRGSVRRLRTFCSSPTTAQAAASASIPRCGRAAWLDRPFTRMVNSCPPAIRAPARTPIRPTGISGSTWRETMPSTPFICPALMISRAPKGSASSAGWNTQRTVPENLSRSAWSASATPSRTEVWTSWPQACITPAFLEWNGRSGLRSSMGRASMSARKARVRPLPLPRMVATRPVSNTGSISEMPALSSMRRTSAEVSRSSWDSSGFSWMARRALIMVSAKAGVMLRGRSDMKPFYSAAVERAIPAGPATDSARMPARLT